MPRPNEELYDRSADPWELKNLVEDPAHVPTLAELRGNRACGERGQTSEIEVADDADLVVYLESRNDEPERLQRMQKNIAQMTAWARDGK